MTDRSPSPYDPEQDSAILLGVGAAHAVADPDPDPEPADAIRVPFEGARGSLRGGWRSRSVSAATRPTTRQPLGFRPR